MHELSLTHTGRENSYDFRARLPEQNNLLLELISRTLDRKSLRQNFACMNRKSFWAIVVTNLTVSLPATLIGYHLQCGAFTGSGWCSSGSFSACIHCQLNT